MPLGSSNKQTTNYIGRFAPSPTGPLHIGSLFAALGSFLQAKNNAGQWLVRMEDIDPPREVKGASTDILKTLERYHLYWDGEVNYQHNNQEQYNEYLDQLRKEEILYPCTCSRKTILENAQFGPLGMIYTGKCRNTPLHTNQQHSLRMMMPDIDIEFADQIQARIQLNFNKNIGDVVLKRADGFYAYHLAVVIDDYHQAVTEIVRGSDLLFSTPVHLQLQQYLGFNSPSYAHLPVIVNSKGEKLSKQTGANKVDMENIDATLIQLLNYLGQNPPSELTEGSTDNILNWAIENWQPENIPRVSIVKDELTC